MRAVVAGLVAVILTLGVASAQDDDEYGEKVCNKYSANLPYTCSCAGPILEEEFEEEELEIVFEFLALVSNPNSQPKDLEAFEAKHGKAKLDPIGKRFETVGSQLQACMKKP
jgi:hypothetical protein